MLSITEVKQQLPMVKIKWGGKHYWGRVSGRLNQFASVSPYQVIDNCKLVKTIIGPRFEFSWHTVTEAINKNRELLADLD